MSHVVYLGNPAPHAPVSVGGEVISRSRTRLVDGDEVPWESSVSLVHWQPDIVEQLLQDAVPIAEACKDRAALYMRVLDEEVRGLAPWELAVQHVLKVVRHHAAEGVSWIAADEPALQGVLVDILGGAHAPGGTADALRLADLEGESWGPILDGITGPTALKTEKGVEVIAKASFGTATQPAALNYVALTANVEAPKATSESLTGEINKASGGLNRKQGTFAFTLATGVATITVTFTANSNDALPVEVAKFGVFNASSGGTMGIETKLSSTVAFKVENDNMTLTDTITIT